MIASYHIRAECNIDGEHPYVWVVYINDVRAKEVFSSRQQATDFADWMAHCDLEQAALAAEDEAARAETFAQTQDRERNQ